jgi:hypothetical protein
MPGSRGSDPLVAGDVHWSRLGQPRAHARIGRENAGNGGQLRSYLGVREVNYVQGHQRLAIVDKPLSV